MPDANTGDVAVAGQRLLDAVDGAAKQAPAPLAPQGGGTVRDEVMLIDLSSLGHPIWHMSGDEPDQDYVSQRIVARVRELSSDHPHGAICCDSPKSWRKEADPTYKANRPRSQAPLMHQMGLARAQLKRDGWPVWTADGFEADDLIASAVDQLDAPCIVVSADKDLLQLVSPTCAVVSAMTGDRYESPEDVAAKFGVSPAQLCDWLTLVGDASDNVKGAPGIGAKTATALLSTYGDLEGIYRALQAGTNGVDGYPEHLSGEARRRGLEAFAPLVDDTRRLIELRTDVELPVADALLDRVPHDSDSVSPSAPQPDPNPGDDPPPPERIVEDHPAPPDPPIDRLVPEPAPTVAAPVSLAVLPREQQWERSLEPRSIDDARGLSKWLHESRMFNDYGTPQAVMSTILLGRELGMPTMAALRSVHVIKGRHSLSADLMVALVLRSGLAERFDMVATTATEATFETQRKGSKPVTLTFTMEDAERAKLTGGENWKKYPAPMLRARCKSDLARLVYPDLLAGLYTPDELRDA